MLMKALRSCGDLMASNAAMKLFSVVMDVFPIFGWAAAAARRRQAPEARRCDRQVVLPTVLVATSDLRDGSFTRHKASKSLVLLPHALLLSR